MLGVLEGVAVGLGVIEPVLEDVMLRLAVIEGVLEGVILRLADRVVLGVLDGVPV